MGKLYKIYNSLMILLVLSMFVYASGIVTVKEDSFVGETNPFILIPSSFNETIFIEIPMFANVTGFNFTVNQIPNIRANDSFQNISQGFSNSVFNLDGGSINRFSQDNETFLDPPSSLKIEDNSDVVEFDQITSNTYSTVNTNFSNTQFFNVSYRTNSSVLLRVGLLNIKNEAGTIICGIGKDNSIANNFAYFNGATYQDTGITINNNTWYNLSIKTIDNNCFYYINSTEVASLLSTSLKFNNTKKVSLLSTNRQDGKANWWEKFSYKNMPLNITTIGNDTTYLNNILNNGCNCTNCSISNNRCTLPINILHKNISTFSITLTNLSYEYGIDKCSNPDVNFTILNMSYIDSNTLSPITASNTYDLQIQSPFNQTIAGTFSSKTNNALCTNVNVTKRGLVYPLFGSINIESSGFTSRIFQNDLSNAYNTETNPFTSLLLPLIPNSSSLQTTFIIKNLLDTQALTNVQTQMFQVINGSDFIVESRLSDITGKVVFNYIENTHYRFVFTKNGFTTLSFDANPITSSSFEVFLTPSTQINNTPDYDRISLNFVPQIYRDDREMNFNFTIVSPFSDLQRYGYTITYPGGTVSNTGNTAAGETLRSNFNIVGASVFDRVKIDYFYDIPQSGLRNFTAYYDIQTTPGNLTLVANKDKTYGLGLFEVALIGTLIIVLIVGLGTLAGQPIAAMGMGVIVMGYFVAIGFWHIWMALIPIFIAVILLSAKAE